jgi:hypothetical protein
MNYSVKRWTLHYWSFGLAAEMASQPDSPHKAENASHHSLLGLDFSPVDIPDVTGDPLLQTVRNGSQSMISTSSLVLTTTRVMATSTATSLRTLLALPRRGNNWIYPRQTQRQGVLTRDYSFMSNPLIKRLHLHLSWEILRESLLSQTTPSLSRKDKSLLDRHIGNNPARLVSLKCSLKQHHRMSRAKGYESV